MPDLFAAWRSFYEAMGLSFDYGSEVFASAIVRVVLAQALSVFMLVDDVYGPCVWFCLGDGFVSAPACRGAGGDLPLVLLQEAGITSTFQGK